MFLPAGLIPKLTLINAKSKLMNAKQNKALADTL